MNQEGCAEYREDIAEALDQAAVLVMRHLTDRTGLGITAISVLARLSEEGPARLTALAAAEGVSQPSMSQLVQRLEQQGLAARAGDPGDGRAALIAVADAGRALLADLRQARHIRLADLLAALPAEDEAALTLAMHVALPIIQRMIRNAAQAGTPNAAQAGIPAGQPRPDHTPESATGTKRTRGGTRRRDPAPLERQKTRTDTTMTATTSCP